MPNNNLGLKLSPEELRVAVALRLGSPVQHPQVCKCGVITDEFGWHALSCKFNGGRISRHNEVNNLIQRALASAHIASRLEPQIHHNLRPDGMTLIPWSKGLCLIWDFTCSNTMATSYRQITNQNGVAELAQTRKRTKYKPLETSYIFLPMATETLGGWASEAEEFLDVLGSRLMKESNEPRAKNFLLQRLSVAIQRGNSKAILEGCLANDKLKEIEIL